MDLRDFISQAIEQVIDGVADGARYADAQQNGSRVMPTRDNGLGRQMFTTSTVKFDVAVTVAESKQNEKSGRLAVSGMFSLSGAKANATQARSESTSRIQFEVEMVLPTNDEKYDPPPPRPPASGDVGGGSFENYANG